MGVYTVCFVFTALIAAAGSYWRATERRKIPTRSEAKAAVSGDGWSDPDNMGKDDWQADEPDVPEPKESHDATFRRRRASFGERLLHWDGLLNPGERFCPKCRARTTQRVKDQLPPVGEASFSVRARDGALWCSEHGLFVRCSEDTIIRAPDDPPAEEAA